MSDHLEKSYGIRSNRRSFIGGSDARIIMGNNEPALIRLWREESGEIEPEDLSGNLVVQLGVATEELNRRWYQANSGQRAAAKSDGGNQCTLGSNAYDCLYLALAVDHQCRRVTQQMNAFSGNFIRADSAGFLPGRFR